MKSLFLIFSILTFANISIANTDCLRNDQSIYLDKDGNFNFFLYEDSYQIYPIVTDFKRGIFITKFWLKTSPKLCFEMKSNTKGMKAFKKYLNMCYFDLKISYNKEEDLIEGKSSKDGRHFKIKRCDWNIL